MKTRRLLICVTILALGSGVCASGTALAQDTPVAQETQTVQTAPAPSKAGPFAQGKVRVGFYGGLGSTFNQSYLILGAGVGFFLFDGLEAGVDGEGWLLQDPTIGKVTPQLRYVFYQAGAIKPYLGAFYRYTFIGSPYEDYSSYGGRFGIAYQQGRSYLAIGGVYERYTSDNFSDNDTIYPEVAFWLSF